MPRVSLPPLLSILLFFLVWYRTVVDNMDELTRNGITPSLSKSEIMEALCKLPAITLKSVRTALFAETKSKGLCVPAAAILVNRRDTAACPISAKLSHDIWTLIDCLRHNINVPRILMRNGKRDRITFEASTISGPLLESSFPMPTDQSSPPLPPPRLPSQLLLSREVFATSAVMRELNLLKNEVRDIKSALSSLSRTQASDTALRHEVANMCRALSNILSSKGPDPDPLASTIKSTSQQPQPTHKTQTQSPQPQPTHKTQTIFLYLGMELSWSVKCYPLSTDSS